jgi:hypothetical protein
MQLTEAATLDRKSREAEGSAVSSTSYQCFGWSIHALFWLEWATTFPENVFRQSAHWPAGPPEVMKNASVQQPLSNRTIALSFVIPRGCDFLISFMVLVAGKL